MSIPSKDDTQQNPPAESKETKELTPDEKVAAAETRRKDTQAEFTKSQQKLKAAEAREQFLQEQLDAHNKVVISPEDQIRLDDLKFNDPDKWRIELNKLEQANLADSRVKSADLSSEAGKAAERKFELDRRQKVLTEFNNSTETPITDEVLAKDVPARITDKLNEGKVTFEEFLVEVETYLKTGKVIKNESTMEQPNLGDLGGNATPGKDNHAEESLDQKYDKDLY